MPFNSTPIPRRRQLKFLAFGCLSDVSDDALVFFRRDSELEVYRYISISIRVYVHRYTVKTEFERRKRRKSIRIQFPFSLYTDIPIYL